MNHSTTCNARLPDYEHFSEPAMLWGGGPCGKAMVDGTPLVKLLLESRRQLKPHRSCVWTRTHFPGCSFPFPCLQQDNLLVLHLN